MAKPFGEFRKQMSTERRARNKAGTQTLLREIRLNDLRRALQLSQEQIADSLDVKQSTVSKWENQTDTLISTLRRYLEAMGIRLVIRAQFPDGQEVEINQFRDLEPIQKSESDREDMATA